MLLRLFDIEGLLWVLGSRTASVSSEGHNCDAWETLMRSFDSLPVVKAIVL